MTLLYIDADACPVKDEALKVARRHNVKTILVCDGGLRPLRDPLVEIVVVPSAPDAADDWIADAIQSGDICVTNDIPLGDRCLKSGAFAIRPNGDEFTPDNIGMALATRSLMQGLRDQGQVSGGPRPFSKADRSTFLNHLETLMRKAKTQSLQGQNTSQQ